MKKISLLFLFSIIFVNAQTYDFDYLVSYSFESLPNCKGESSVYVNTKSEGYYLKVVKFLDNLQAQIIDQPSNKIHYFAVNEIKRNNEVLYEFQYDYSGDFKNSIWCHNSKSVFSIKSNTKEDVENIELQVYKNLKKKKKESHFSLDVKKSDNLFSAFEYCCIHPHQFIQKEKPKNLLVTKVTETTKKGQLINYELKTLKEVNFKLIVPEGSEIKYMNSL